jgi:hypothetical protein
MPTKEHKASTTRPSTTKTNPLASINALLKERGAQVTEGDKATAAFLNSIYQNRNTPELFKGLILQSFFDVAEHFKVSSLPNDLPKHWLKLWPSLLAALRVQGGNVTKIRYTWQPTEAEAAALDAEEREAAEAEAEARAVFNLIDDERLPAAQRQRFTDEITDIVMRAAPNNVFEVFRVAWPIALTKLAEEEGSGEL